MDPAPLYGTPVRVPTECDVRLFAVFAFRARVLFAQSRLARFELGQAACPTASPRALLGHGHRRGVRNP